MRVTRLVLGLASLTACSHHKSGPRDMGAQSRDLALAGDLSGSAPSDLSAPDLASATFAVAGTIAGLLGHGLVLQDNGGDDLPVAADGNFTFATRLADGASYAVTVKSAPAHPIQTCAVTRGSGTIAGADIGNVSIACSNDATDWLQFNFDAQHDGWNVQESTLTPANVKMLKPKMHVTLPSVADGAPAYLRSVVTASGTRDLVFVTTRAGHIFALDSLTLGTIWSQQPATTPNYTTSSPAIEPTRRFVFSYGLEGRVHQYAVGSGNEVVTGGWPELATLKPSVEKGSSALGIAVATSGSYLYVTNGGYPGDAGDYQGHVTAVNLATGAQHVFNANCSDRTVHFDVAPAMPNCTHVQTAVWARSGVVYSAELDRLFFSTGNGDYDGNMAGGFDWGDSLLSIRPDGTGTATGPLDSYTPTEFATLQAEDADLGSTAPALLPTPPGSKLKHLAVQSQKKPNASESQVRLVNLDNLSGQGGPGHVGGELEKINVPQGGEVLTALAIWVNPADGSDWFFIANDSGISGVRIDVAADGTPSFSPSRRWTNATPSTSPIVANNMVFVATTTGVSALDPTTGNRLWLDASIGGLHWESPIVVNGQVYVTDEGGAIWRFAF
jgi:hypothetical protein